MISDHPQSTLPHRDPFLWVTRLLARNETGTEGSVELDLSPENPVFRGHFPGKPIFPGVLQLEAAAQACLWVNVGQLPEGAKAPEPLFVAVDSFKFKRPVVPPVTLLIQVKQERVRSSIQLWTAEIKAGDQIVSQGTLWLKML